MPPNQFKPCRIFLDMNLWLIAKIYLEEIFKRIKISLKVKQQKQTILKAINSFRVYFGLSIPLRSIIAQTQLFEPSFSIFQFSKKSRFPTKKLNSFITLTTRIAEKMYPTLDKFHFFAKLVMLNLIRRLMSCFSNYIVASILPT